MHGITIFILSVWVIKHSMFFNIVTKADKSLIINFRSLSSEVCNVSVSTLKTYFLKLNNFYAVNLRSLVALFFHEHEKNDMMGNYLLTQESVIHVSKILTVYLLNIN